MKDNGVVWPDMQESSVGTMVSYQDGVTPQNGSNATVQDQARFEADKRAVYKHPLFPLLALLFERCEQATQLAETPSSESFNLDIQAFVQHQERDRKPFLINDAEIDGLMIKAIQVLRIHLLELEKVQELCKDFCNRYITALKGKMQSENLLRSDYASGYLENNNNSGHSSDSNSPTVFAPHSPHNLQVGLGGWQASTGQQHVSSTSSGVQGSTPLSQIGVSPHPPSIDSLSTTSQGCLTSGGSCDEDDDSIGRGGKKQKRGILPKQATSIMRSWLFQHLVHPYPTEDEKRQIAAQTDLTLLQVNNWFINARRRILQPMLDASSPNESLAAGANTIKPVQIGKKNKSNGLKSSQRYWPDGMGRLSVDSTLEGSDEWDSDEDDSLTSSIAPAHSSDTHSLRDTLPSVSIHSHTNSQISDDSQQ